MLQIALLSKQEVIELLTKLTDLEVSDLSLEMENLQAKKLIVNSLHPNDGQSKLLKVSWRLKQ